MRTTLIKTTLTVLLSIPAAAAFAQNEPGQSDNSQLLIYGLVAVALLIFFFIVIQVSDNLLVIEAKQTGADKTGNNFSLFPGLADLFRPSLPDYLTKEPHTVFRRGHDIPLGGTAAPQISTAIGTRYAIKPTDFLGMQPIPKVVVEVGDSVKAGDPLFFNKKMPEVQYCAPVSGEIIEVNRGMKRAITEVVILADKKQVSKTYDLPNLESVTREELVEFLLGSGVWPMIRQRPFNVIADPQDVPRDIFVSSFNSGPLAPDTNITVEGREAAFQRGLDILNKLTDGRVFLGLDGRSAEAPSPVFTNATGVIKHYFRGAHPSGNVGVQLHNLAPLGNRDKVWTLGVPEVLCLGELFDRGIFDASRIVALTGSVFKEPHYVRTHIGANIGELIAGQLDSTEGVRLISGDVLSGLQTTTESYLNFYDSQLTAITEGTDPEMFGWLLPLKSRDSISPTIPLLSDEFDGDTNTHGEKRAFVVTSDYETLLPMDIYLQQLMKSILVNDFEAMEGLGLQELVEEDVALAEFACVSKQPLQQILRQGLETMREQS
jgi:Na+-transporting NADH:ubiquinone oxidoreductase subunit A